MTLKKGIRNQFRIRGETARRRSQAGSYRSHSEFHIRIECYIHSLRIAPPSKIESFDKSKLSHSQTDLLIPQYGPQF